MGRPLPLFDRAEAARERIALETPSGSFSRAWLLQQAAAGAACLLDGRSDLREARVAFLTERDESYVATQWAIWRAGGIAVPLCDSHADPEIEYVLDDAGAAVVVVSPGHSARIGRLTGRRGIRLLTTRDLSVAGPCPSEPWWLSVQDPLSRRAMMIYTSGTTGRPKGVVTTHANLKAQCESLVQAWAWTADDVVLQVLPLHHVHGIVNVVYCALWSGARCRMLPRFDARVCWEAIAQGGITLLMAVPTIYSKLIAAYEALPPGAQRRASDGCRAMRLMVSGSAALPQTVLERWRQISGHVLLERYGMTEIGMALGNPLRGERRPGYVGVPMPGMEVRIVDDAGVPVGEGAVGEIEVRGPQVFREYWGRPEATCEAFRDGWFRTGDVAVVEDGYVRILGRSSVDIIKSGGYKISALEIEEVLRDHPAVLECAVVGVDDPEWGERVCAVVVLRPGSTLDLAALRAFARDRLASYKLPSRLDIVPELPRNTLGKVLKPELRSMLSEG